MEDNKNLENLQNEEVKNENVENNEVKNEEIKEQVKAEKEIFAMRIIHTLSVTKSKVRIHSR